MGAGYLGPIDTRVASMQRCPLVADKVLTLRDMTDGSGCTPRTVRYYERQGLLRALRSGGGHRLFATSELERLQFIISLREAGWALEEVGEFLTIRGRADCDADAVTSIDELLRAHVDRLEKKIEVLQRLRRDLGATSQLLPVCADCTTGPRNVDCDACARLPPLPSLPRSFRVIWRARELHGAAIYDENRADEDESG